MCNEYNFESVEKNVADRGATKLQLLTPEVLEVLPTENLICERQLSEFDRRAVFAKTRNRNFKAKGIRDHMVLYNACVQKINKMTRTVDTSLHQQEANWRRKKRHET